MNRIGRKGRKTLKGTEAFLAATPIRSPSFAVPPPNGGARRDRTDDLMLAKHALSQLSYGPVGGRRTSDDGQCLSSVFPQPSSWWAWEDLNLRPHAYQARALTN